MVQMCVGQSLGLEPGSSSQYIETTHCFGEVVVETLNPIFVLRGGRGTVACVIVSLELTHILQYCANLKPCFKGNWVLD